MVDLRVKVGSTSLATPLIAASGTFGFGREMARLIDFSCLGAVCSKGLTLEPKDGNKPPRVAETASGMLNSVGLQNPGIQHFLAEELPFMQKAGPKVIVNIAGECVQDYVSLAEKLNLAAVEAIEVNLSCPNVQTGCMQIGSDAKNLKDVIQAVRQVTEKPLWAKLTPNVTDIAALACAAENAGADAIVVINTLLGMAIDWPSRRPVLHNNTGGLSGPAIKPVALRMTHEVSRAVSIPVVGVGGIMTADDVLEFIVAGARAVEIGTANLVDPAVLPRLQADLASRLQEAGISEVKTLCGSLKPYS